MSPQTHCALSNAQVRSFISSRKHGDTGKTRARKAIKLKIFSASPCLRGEKPCAVVGYFEIHQDSSYTSHVPSHGRWRDGSAVERRGLGSPLGSIRTAEGGKSGANAENSSHIYGADRHDYRTKITFLSPRFRRSNHRNCAPRCWSDMVMGTNRISRSEMKVAHYRLVSPFDFPFSPPLSLPA